jgi:mono/diheme cytochrome c family protein
MSNSIYCTTYSNDLLTATAIRDKRTKTSARRSAHQSILFSQYIGRSMRLRLLLTAMLLAAILAGCGTPKSDMTDSELGLSAQQAAGRRIFEANCAACHSAYSSLGSRGPSLEKLLRKSYLPSGLPATDRFVEQTIIGGRGMMPPLGDALTQPQLDDLIAYLHTL